ncbi:MAG: non-canonical purine NTP diphosphatase [Muribaculaceae bacterium]
MIKYIVFATNNEHKLKELREIVGDSFNILSLKYINCNEEIPETANSLEGNALIKARHIKDIYGYDCFADDTGLEISALNNEPGVYSARYAGEDCIAENNINKVLKLMDNCEDFSARFRTIFALIIGNDIKYFEGIVEGTIIKEKRGIDGFGYDPIFVPKGFNKTFAEMNSEEKNKISHRGLATQKLIDYLQNI